MSFKPFLLIIITIISISNASAIIFNDLTLQSTDETVNVTTTIYYYESDLIILGNDYVEINNLSCYNGSTGNLLTNLANFTTTKNYNLDSLYSCSRTINIKLAQDTCEEGNTAITVFLSFISLLVLVIIATIIIITIKDQGNTGQQEMIKPLLIGLTVIIIIVSIIMSVGSSIVQSMCNTIG